MQSNRTFTILFFLSFSLVLFILPNPVLAQCTLNGGVWGVGTANPDFFLCTGGGNIEINAIGNGGTDDFTAQNDAIIFNAVGGDAVDRFGAFSGGIIVNANGGGGDDVFSANSGSSLTPLVGMITISSLRVVVESSSILMVETVTISSP